MRSRLVLLCAAVFAGCANPALPDGAQISCESNAGCPKGTICAGPLERCVVDKDDQDPPGLVGAPEVSPKVGTEGTTFDITIVADEPLGRPPTVIARSQGAVVIALPEFRLLSDEDGDGGDRRTYRYDYTAAGNEPEGVAVIGVELVDESGRPAQFATDSFVLDFVAPRIITSSVDNALAKADTTVTVSLTFNEPLSSTAAPEVFLPESFPETANLVFVPGTVDGQTQFFSYTTTGNEVEGRRSIHATVFDAAGNATDGSEGGGGGTFETTLVVTFDFTPPRPGNSVMDVTPHGANELITSSIDFDEVLATEVFVGGDVGFEGAPAVRAIPRVGDPEIDALFLDVVHTRAIDDVFQTESTRLILQFRVRGCELPGIYDIVLDNVIDLAGNEADDVRGPWQFELADVGCE